MVPDPDRDEQGPHVSVTELSKEGSDVAQGLCSKREQADDHVQDPEAAAGSVGGHPDRRLTPYGLQILVALTRNIKHVYGGTVSAEERKRRRIRNKVQRRSRRLNRG